MNVLQHTLGPSMPGDVNKLSHSIPVTSSLEIGALIYM